MSVTTPSANPYFEAVPAGASQAEALNNAIQVCTAAGWRLQNVYGGVATMVSGSPVNHVLYLLLTIFTFGLGAIVWIIVAVTNQGEKHLTIIADEQGNVRYQEGR
jgi:hypothetical protein